MRAGKKFGIIFVIIAVVGLGLLAFGGNFFGPKPAPGKTVDPNTLPGITTSHAPWSPELANLRSRLSAISLPALSTEGTVLHTHEHLDIFVEGQSVPVPADIGIPADNSFISPLHTHDDTQVIHVESQVTQTFTLGQFFDVRGVRFTDTCLGGYCSDSQRKLRVFVNGQEVQQNFRDVALAEHQEIAVFFGTPQQAPNPVPGSYNFPADL
jgi:hypothetical protein